MTTEVNQANTENINTGIAMGVGEEITEHLSVETQVYGPAIGATLEHAMVVVVDTLTEIDELNGQMVYVQIEKGTALLVPINEEIEVVIKGRNNGEDKVSFDLNDPTFPKNLVDYIADVKEEACQKHAKSSTK